MKKIHALGKKVILKGIVVEQKVGGLIIPTDSHERPTQMQVVSIGEDADCALEIGQTVIIPPYGWAEIKVDDQTYYSINSDDLIAIVS